MSPRFHASNMDRTISSSPATSPAQYLPTPAARRLRVRPGARVGQLPMRDPARRSPREPCSAPAVRKSNKIAPGSCLSGWRYPSALASRPIERPASRWARRLSGSPRPLSARAASPANSQRAARSASGSSAIASIRDAICENGTRACVHRVIASSHWRGTSFMNAPVPKLPSAQTGSHVEKPPGCGSSGFIGLTPGSLG